MKTEAFALCRESENEFRTIIAIFMSEGSALFAKNSLNIWDGATNDASPGAYDEAMHIGGLRMFESSFGVKEEFLAGGDNVPAAEYTVINY